MLKFTSDMFLDTDARWQALYAKGVCWCPSGIKGLASSEINPYHCAVPQGSRTDKHNVVYAIYDETIVHADWLVEVEPDHCFFEDDYVDGFARYAKMPNATLRAAYLCVKAPSLSAKEVYQDLDNRDYMDESHGNSVHWSKKYKSWMF